MRKVTYRMRKEFYAALFAECERDPKKVLSYVNQTFNIRYEISAIVTY